MFKPVNRYILIEMTQAEPEGENSLIVLPEDYKKPEPTHASALVVCAAEDVRFAISEGERIVIDRSMIEEISVDGTIYNVILDNYVVAIV